MKIDDNRIMVKGEQSENQQRRVISGLTTPNDIHNKSVVLNQTIADSSHIKSSEQAKAIIDSAGHSGTTTPNNVDLNMKGSALKLNKTPPILRPKLINKHLVAVIPI